jgi:hypothetical protein
MKRYQRLFTENLYGVGLVNYPGALVINKRFANIPPGAPIFPFNWAEDNIMRERVYVPEDRQQDHELHPRHAARRARRRGARDRLVTLGRWPSGRFRPHPPAEHASAGGRP